MDKIDLNRRDQFLVKNVLLYMEVVYFGVVPGTLAVTNCMLPDAEVHTVTMRAIMDMVHGYNEPCDWSVF